MFKRSYDREKFPIIGIVVTFSTSYLLREESYRVLLYLTIELVLLA